MSTASPRAQPQALFKFCHVFLLGELWASKARSALCRSMRLDYLSHVPRVSTARLEFTVLLRLQNQEPRHVCVGSVLRSW